MLFCVLKTATNSLSMWAKASSFHPVSFTVLLCTSIAKHCRKLKTLRWHSMRLYWRFYLVLYLNLFHLRSEASNIVFHLRVVEIRGLCYEIQATSFVFFALVRLNIGPINWTRKHRPIHYFVFHSCPGLSVSRYTLLNIRIGCYFIIDKFLGGFV